MMSRARAIYQEHTSFVLFAVLFVSFRVMTLLLYRPGGFFADFSDYNIGYLSFARWSDLGLYPFIHYWLEYPPPFAWLVVAVYRLSLLLPQWTDPRLWYNTLLGLSFLPFEVGNFVLIYLLGQEIYDRGKALLCALIYAGLFAPIYVWSGWNDSLPVFFLLLGLYLVIKRQGVAGGAVAGIGFWFKVTPLLLLPLGLRVLDGLRRKTAFLVASAVAWGMIALPFALVNSGFLWAFFANLVGRSSWETVWALWDGYYSYGVVTGDRLSIPSDFSTHSSSVPWPAITLVFAILLLWLYTRRIDYTDKVRSLALAGLTVNLFMLYSKGYSPQFIVQLIPFVVLLLPHLRGVAYIILLDVINFLEATVYFIMLPDQTWLLFTTVLLRTLLLVALTFEYGLILFDVSSTRATTLHRRASIALLAGTALSLAALVYPLGQAYVSSRRQVGVYGSASTVVPAQSLPCGPGIEVGSSADARSAPDTGYADVAHPLFAGESPSADLCPRPAGDAQQGEMRRLTYAGLRPDHAQSEP